MVPELILINPWIHDFAAYDLWAKPLGLLYQAGRLRDLGFKVTLIDCLDVHHPAMKGDPCFSRPVRRAFGTGKFWRKKIPKPAPLKDFPRDYYRYGISRPLLAEALKAVPRPSAILVTSLMTYWYPGVIEVIETAREVHGDTPVILGGIYAALCPDHAREHAGADFLVGQTGLDALDSAKEVLAKIGVHADHSAAEKGPLPFPAFDLLRKIDYVCILTSAGCPYRCAYCASPLLHPRFLQRDPEEVVAEMEYWHRKFGVRDFAFYDDALLIHWQEHLSVILERICAKNLAVRFHTPNALHVKEIGLELARILHRSGFRSLRLGLEATEGDFHEKFDHKLSSGDFERAVFNLKRAGFSRKQIGAYILMGIPGQSPGSVLATIRHVAEVGAVPFLAEYSPIPGTPLWETAVESSPYDLANEPLFHNNSLLPCWGGELRAQVPDLKRTVKEVRSRLR